jgi:PIN domain nuclease of toxin-antitoxin system
VRLLLYTHIALWAVTDYRRLSAKARKTIVDPMNDVCVSAASVWEIAIKHVLARGGPNDLPVSGAEALQHFLDAGYALVEIFPADAAAVETLPTLNADPFDRVLIAQALSVPFRLLTHDPRVSAYSQTIIQV